MVTDPTLAQHIADAILASAQPLMRRIEKLEHRVDSLQAALESLPGVPERIRQQQTCKHEWNRRRDGRWCNKCLKVEFGVFPPLLTEGDHE